jgi:UDP-N-acetylmuramoyl-L-alanyl-D-glutamate--2,6-diaminopimelate ligase
MGRIAAELADQAIVTSDNPRTEDPQRILEDILAGIPAGVNPIVIADRAAAIRAAILQAEPGDGVLIAGKGHEDYQILGTEKIHFDDREQARAALSDRFAPQTSRP